jgi:uncharacterized membrane protein SirB2
MNYYDFKFLHIAMVVLFTYNLVISIYNPRNKFFKISLGISSLFLLISGATLLKRFGVPFTGPFPSWVWAKIAIWLMLAMFPPILLKRVPKFTSKISIVFIGLVLVAGFMGIYKPQ